MRILAASVVFALCPSSRAQESWDVAKCQRALTEATAKAGHVCTPKHLDADLAHLLKDLKGTPIDALGMRFERDLAEGGLVEMGAALARSRAEVEKAQADLKRAEVEADKADADLAAMRAPTVRWTAGSSYSSEFLARGHKVRLIATESLVMLALHPDRDALEGTHQLALHQLANSLSA